MNRLLLVLLALVLTLPVVATGCEGGWWGNSQWGEEDYDEDEDEGKDTGDEEDDTGDTGAAVAPPPAPPAPAR